MDILQNTNLLSELFRCGDELYLWCYDADGTLLKSNCPEASLFDTAFEIFDCKRMMLEYAETQDNPATIGTAFGMKWGAAFEKKEGRLVRAWVIGPFYYQEISMRGIREGLHYYQNLTADFSWWVAFTDAARHLPIVQHALTSRYTLMLHYCLTEEHLNVSDLGNPTADLSFADNPSPEYQDRHTTWLKEQALLDMVRNGDLNYAQVLSEASALSNGLPLQSDDALRQAKTSIIVFTTLVTRAAIEGGLSPEMAYSLGEGYIQSAESAHNVSDLDALGLNMYDDFIRRVHKQRRNQDYPSEIRRCVDYIEMHPEQKIRAKDLADMIGYSEYYLSRRFKEATGKSLSDYVNEVKIARAGILLKDTELSAQEISEDLGFSSRNYFTKVFKDITGVTPTAYREG